MTAAVYERGYGSAIAQLKKKGFPITFTRITSEVKNPSTGAVITPGTTTTHSPNGIFYPVKSNLVDGTRIKMGDQIAMIDGTFEPLMTDKIAGWSIMEIEYLKPTDKLILSFVRVRK